MQAVNPVGSADVLPPVPPDLLILSRPQPSPSRSTVMTGFLGGCAERRPSRR